MSSRIGEKGSCEVQKYIQIAAEHDKCAVNSIIIVSYISDEQILYNNQFPLMRHYIFVSILFHSHTTNDWWLAQTTLTQTHLHKSKIILEYTSHLNPQEVKRSLFLLSLSLSLSL